MYFAVLTFHTVQGRNFKTESNPHKRYEAQCDLICVFDVVELFLTSSYMFLIIKETELESIELCHMFFSA